MAARSMQSGHNSDGEGLTVVSGNKIDIWMPVFIGDFHKETAEFTTEMVGAYILLCLHHWFKGAPPDDDEVLARICKPSVNKFRQIRPDLAFFFKAVNKRWVHEKLQAEFEKWLITREKRSEAAKHAANVRWTEEKRVRKDLLDLPDDAYE